MPIPHADQAIIDPAKLRDYLLSLGHPVGRYKAVVFHAMGYSQAEWQRLESDLRQQHLTIEPSRSSQHPFGQIYEIVGDLTGPSGKIVSILSVWIVLKEEHQPRLVTAYPGRIS